MTASLLTLLLIPAAAFLPSTRLSPHARCERHQQRSVLLAQAEPPVATLEADAARVPAPLAQQPPASAPPASAPPPAAPDAVVSTLRLLEWERLSDQVASFAATGRARSLIRSGGLALPKTREGSEQLLAETAEAYTLEQRLAKPLELRGFKDFTPSVTLAQKGGVLEGEQLADIAGSLTTAAALSKLMRAAVEASGEGDADAPPPLSVLPDMLAGVSLQAELRRELGAAIDDAGDVRDSAAPTLGELRFAMKELAASTRRTLGGIIAKKADALATNTVVYRGERYLLQVVAKQKHRVPGTVRDVSGSGQTLYIEPREVEAANTKLRQLAKKEELLARKVRAELSLRVGKPTTAAELLRLNDAVTAIDLAAARARYSAKLGATPVRFVGGAADAGASGGASSGDATSGGGRGGLELRGLRHPLLVWRNTGEAPDASAVVPMDFEVEPHVRAVVVTGPNTGGKTVSLKTLGLAALMAKAGLWLLCERASGGAAARDGAVALPWFDCVMADIGDEQSIVQSLSTFSAHVARMRTIMATATAESLVLLDEVGAGTDPTEGSALGMAALRRLAGSASLTMATTHHGRLKTLKTTDERFENACVEFDEASLRPTYRLLWGIPGRSNAITIASRLGMPQDVVEGARGLLGEGEVSVDDVVQQLQDQQEERRRLNDELQSARDEARRQSDELARQQRRATSDEEARRASQQAQLAQELAEARETIRELVRLAQNPGAAQKASQAIAKMQRDGDGAAADAAAQAAVAAAQQAASAKPDLKSIEPGDRVAVPRLGEGLLDVEARKGNSLSVQFGGLKMKVKLAEVTSVVKVADLQAKAQAEQQQKQQQRSKQRGGGGNTDRARTVVRFATNTLDIRGLRGAEVAALLGPAVDRASDLGTLWVIHGHGTGSLKAQVRTLLKEEPTVERFEDAPQNEGGAGCTLAYLR